MSPGEGGRYLTAKAEAGLLIIHSTPATLSWVPYDVVNRVYNVGGTVTVGTFDTSDQAKQAAQEQYSVAADAWGLSEELPFDTGREDRTETHTPEIDGHRLLRHGIHWKQT